MAVDIFIPSNPPPQDVEWISIHPTQIADALDGSRATFSVADQYWQLRVTYPPMSPDNFVPHLIQGAQGRASIFSFPVYQPIGKHGFYVGNFVEFTDHTKLYKLIAVPPSVDLTKLELTTAGLPAGWKLHPEPRSVAGRLRVAERFICSLDVDRISFKQEGRGFNQLPTFILRERIGVTLDEVVRYGDGTAVTYGDNSEMRWR